VIGALFDPSAFASGEPAAAETGFDAGLAGVFAGADLAERVAAAAGFGAAFADVFVCVRAETHVIAAKTKTERRIPIQPI